nr:DUF2064 domain-containing protein [Chloroflexota bacterium]
QGHEAIAFLDGDGSCDPGDLPRLRDALLRPGADVALGRRAARGIERGALPWHARLGNAVVAAILGLRTGRRVRDLPPCKIFRAEALARMALDDQGYGWTVQSIARALADPATRVVERPVHFRRRRGGRSKVSGSVGASLAAGRAMLSVAWRETRPRPVLALMAKAPGDGRAKTRLAADIGSTPTEALWAACLADGGRVIGRSASALGMHTVAFVPDLADQPIVGRSLGPTWRTRVQDRRGLGGALVDAFLHGFDGGSSWAMAISADAPTVPKQLIAAAADALSGKSKAILGPCPDGGYYSIGLRWTRRWPLIGGWQRRRLVTRLEATFGSVRMGGADALSSTGRALVEHGWPVTVLPEWSDLDVGGDLPVLADAVAGHPEDFPHVADWLAANRELVDRWRASPAPSGPAAPGNEPPGAPSSAGLLAGRTRGPLSVGELPRARAVTPYPARRGTLAHHHRAVPHPFGGAHPHLHPPRAREVSRRGRS